MFDMQTVIASMALILWGSAVFWFFRRDIVAWWQRRSAGRVERKKLAVAMVAERTRLLEELAERHSLPPRGPHNRG
jgi:hypothetical protein